MTFAFRSFGDLLVRRVARTGSIVSARGITDARIRMLNDELKPVKRWFNTSARQPGNVSSGAAVRPPAGQTVYRVQIYAAGVGQRAPASVTYQPLTWRSLDGDVKARRCLLGECEMDESSEQLTDARPPLTTPACVRSPRQTISKQHNKDLCSPLVTSRALLL